MVTMHISTFSRVLIVPLTTILVLAGYGLLKPSYGFEQLGSGTGVQTLCGGDGQPCSALSRDESIAVESTPEQDMSVSIEASNGFDPTTPCPRTSFYDLKAQGITRAQVAAQMSLCLNDFRVNPWKYIADINLIPKADGTRCNYDRDVAPFYQDGKFRNPFQLDTDNAGQMDRIAQQHSDNMATYVYVGHTQTQPFTLTQAQRVQNSGAYGTVPAGGTLSEAENVAGDGQPDLVYLFSQWICSPEHRPNIINCVLQGVGSGAGWEPIRPYSTFFTQNFICTGAGTTCSVQTNLNSCITIAAAGRPNTQPPAPVVASPPPPPPAPATCFPPQIAPAGTACGTLNDYVLLIDQGDGSCFMQTIINNAPVVGPCQGPIFPGFSTCSSLNASLVLVFKRNNPNVAYSNNMQNWLNLVGIGNPRLAFAPITIYVDHAPYPLPPIAPLFLLNLVQVGALVIKECVNCFEGDNNAPAVSSLQSLPGLVNVRQFRDFRRNAGFLGSLFVYSTAFVNMESFTGLECPPGQMQLVNNLGLRNLVGLQRLAYPYWTPGASLRIVGNTIFNGPEALAPIKVYAGCPSGQTTSPQASRPNVRVTTPAGVPCTLTTWNAVCFFIATGNCA
eukprot:jgi/Botrbrau1/20670/Bobra.0058s0004.1